MSQALYRKWRPARFDQVIGQEHVTQTLRNSVAADRLGHAYLFCGPRGTGKTTTARLLAKAANCLHEDPAQRPCDQCRICLAINEGRFLDLIEIDAASNTGVDDIRDLRDKINFAPSEGRFKVYIIDEVHMLSTAAFNALLKTLEEPPPHAKFVLATTEEHKVPLTIKSRCQQFNFRLLTTQEIIGRLEWLIQQEGLSVEDGVLQLVAEHGAGSLRDSESLLDQLVGGPDEEITILKAQAVLGTASSESIYTLTDAIIGRDGQLGLETIHQALNTGADARQFARQMVIYLRHMLLLQTSGLSITLDLPENQLEKISQQAQRCDRKMIIAAIKHFTEAATQTSLSWQSQLPLELAFIESLPATEFVLATPPTAIPMAKPAEVPPEVVYIPPQETPTPATAEAAPPPVVTQAPPPANSNSSSARPEPTPAAKAGPAFSIADLKGKKWREFTAKAGQKNRNYKSWLNMAQPLAVEGETLVIGFDLDFLKDKLAAEEKAVSAILSEVMGQPARIKCVMKSDYNAPAVTQSTKTFRDDVEELAKELGGIVNDLD